MTSPSCFPRKGLQRVRVYQGGLAQGIKKKRFAKAPRARKKIIFAFVYQLFDERGLVNVVVALGADDLKALNAYGELARHKIMLAKEKMGANSEIAHEIASSFAPLVPRADQRRAVLDPRDGKRAARDSR